ncbi:hypothetical protein B0H14DRAFT_2615175 [Mycena olivaceomarginata]|nr:hypothetical protein B0H14DRAFT_2615175 [Mycena olivaceomarginata]
MTPRKNVHLAHSHDAIKRQVRLDESHCFEAWWWDWKAISETGEKRDYDEVQELIDDIKLDCVVTRNSLDREAWALQETGKGMLDGSWLARETAEQNGDLV